MVIKQPIVKMSPILYQEDLINVRELEALCMNQGIALKLELDYKAGVTIKDTGQTEHLMNEFMYFDGDKLVGYIGICGFGGPSGTLEVNGMVHLDYRRQGIFTALYELVLGEGRKRGAKSILLLCDRESSQGQSFIKKAGVKYHHTEYEMYLRKEASAVNISTDDAIVFEKATNKDAKEIARQNSIYFGDEEEVTLMPEEEEKRGMLIYFLKKMNKTIGKVHLQLLSGLGGIYGLGVLPEERGKGYGRKILLESVKRLKEADAKEVMLQVEVTNDRALHLYQSCGFHETSVMDYFEV